jgi:NAD(P)-dependent dehydrogenase (short-subunit alcohol dehydrogenase family)
MMRFSKKLLSLLEVHRLAHPWERINFGKSLAKQLGPKGIRVNGVVPRPIRTPLQISSGVSKGKVVTFEATTPVGRPGQPAELAGIYVR